MGIDVELLRELCGKTLERTDLGGLGERIEGKVRDGYRRDGQRVLVTSDRVSCFDVVVGTIPLKGQVLNQLAAFWFEKTRPIAPNHLVEVPDPNVSVVREAEMLPVEFVMRGFLTGSSPTSIWTAYERGDRRYCGHTLPEGLVRHQKLPENLLTPTTKAEKGDHDELTSREEILERGLVSEARYDEAARLAHALFAAGQEWAEKQGLLLVDTKYEMGVDAEGHLVVADEIHTPDSSRYWYRESWERAMQEGGDPQALDKEYVRRWLTRERGWRGEGPPPELPVEVRCEAARRYVEAYERITGGAFEPDTEDPAPRIRRRLGL